MRRDTSTGELNVTSIGTVSPAMYSPSVPATRTTVGGSSSAMKSCAGATVKPVAAPDTVTVSAGSSAASSVGANAKVAVPVLCVASIVTVNGVTAAKSAAAAVSPATATATSVSVVPA